MPLSNVLRYVVIGLIVALLLGFLYWIWSAGNSHGRNAVQTDWDRQQKLYALAIQATKDNYAVAEASNRATTQRLTDELAAQNVSHQSELDAAKYDLSGRLQQSEARAAIYKRQASSGSAQCSALASHAAELDRSLEQGRSLVRELRETLRFRDEQLRAVSAKLLADRQLLTLDEPDGR
ncbi:putative Rz/Rzl spanin protein [Erwinia phage vB_EamP_Rexella]|uniref:Putative Rz/Rzl spanin protein n=1 Tax=Erwinia phage vB_EamP_Rexella TaxID=1852642 RepID=A0A191ZD44_9CAUD|nr:putative Rz/Rzl spanin protein [Erwinia phage vB_EamP_Rexella]